MTFNNLKWFQRPQSLYFHIFGSLYIHDQRWILNCSPFVAVANICIYLFTFCSCCLYKYLFVPSLCSYYKYISFFSPFAAVVQVVPQFESALWSGRCSCRPIREPWNIDHNKKKHTKRCFHLERCRWNSSIVGQCVSQPAHLQQPWLSLNKFIDICIYTFVNWYICPMFLMLFLLMCCLTWTKDGSLSLLDLLPRLNCYSSERGENIDVIIKWLQSWAKDVVLHDMNGSPSLMIKLSCQ